MSMTTGGAPTQLQNDAGRSRVLSLVDFLQEYDSIKNPPVRDITTYGKYLLWGEGLPELPSIRLTPDADTWLTVDFVELPPRPEIPEELAQYLPRDHEISARAVPEVAWPADSAEWTPEQLEAGRADIKAVDEWIRDLWEPWSVDWLKASVSKVFYRGVFEQLRLIADDRETYELVWGFGRVRWSGPGFDISHPVFTVPVEIERHPDQSLTIAPTGALELEALCFAGIEIADRTQMTSRRRALEENPLSPWDASELHDNARTVLRTLDDLGVMAGEGDPQRGHPVMDTGWVLYVRRRRPDYQGYLDKMRELYLGGVTPPDALRSIVVDAPSALAGSDDSAAGYLAGDTGRAITSLEPLLLPLPSNDEQRRILELAQRQSGVVVQGPPGTGKSHTIANLISHYVAYGHRVLVVAEKEQALRVLADKIPAEIQSLAVSVLGADRSGQSALEASIQTIQGRVAGMDTAAQDRMILDAAEQLAEIDRKIAETVDQLMRARQAEAETLPGAWPCGNNPTPTSAADWLARNEAAFGFIPDRLPPTAVVPMEAADLADLVRLLSEVGMDRARECAFTLPDLLRLPTATSLGNTLTRSRELWTSLGQVDGYVDWAVYDEADAHGLTAFADYLNASHAYSAAADLPWVTAMNARILDPMLRAEWAAFATAVTAEREQILALRPLVAASIVTVPDPPPVGFRDHLVEGRSRLSDRGRLGRFAGDTRKAIELCSVDGRPPATAADVDLCIHAVDIAQLRRALRLRWSTQMAMVAGPELDSSRPEEFGDLLQLLGYVLTRSELWTQTQASALQFGIRLQGVGSTADLDLAKAIVAVAAQRPEARRLDGELTLLRQELGAGAQGATASPHWTSLLDALDGERLDDWDAYLDQIRDLVGIAPSALRLSTLHATLDAAAPLWAKEIVDDPACASDPTRLSDAWAWRQLDTWVAGVIAAQSPDQLQRAIEELAAKRRRRVAELVGLRAWRRLADSLGDRERQSLNSYLSAVRRFGKTGGKFRARWLEAIRVALNDSKDAVPVWIMPTSRALTSFRPDGRVPFDVIIVDEASQIELTALPLLSLAKRAIVVGDDKQTSPSVIGLNQERVFQLIDTHLSAVPHSKTLFNPGNSLYDLASHKFPGRVMLREHFRCLPEIIEFSNRLYYNGAIEPLRDQRPAPEWPALGAVKVLDGCRSAGGVNEPEAHATVDLLSEMVHDAKYDGMDFGVICLLSGGQAELVKELLFDRLGPDVITDRRIRVGDAANFQGDERDVMVISLVAATDPMNPTARIGSMTSVGDGQRMNVAASRARQQMWVVHSLEPERFSSGDPRAELIRHCRDPRAFTDAVEDEIAKCDSEFERMVLARIAAQGYRRIRSQVRVGTENNSYRIDLVVEGPKSRLAVECDGEQWHGPERWHADRARQEVLERAGWTFVRIRGSAYFRDPDLALEPLWERLDRLAIPTGDEWLQAPAETATVRDVYGMPPTEDVTFEDDDLEEDVA